MDMVRPYMNKICSIDCTYVSVNFKETRYSTRLIGQIVDRHVLLI